MNTTHRDICYGDHLWKMTIWKPACCWQQASDDRGWGNIIVDKILYFLEKILYFGQNTIFCLPKYYISWIRYYISRTKYYISWHFWYSPVTDIKWALCQRAPCNCPLEWNIAKIFFSFPPPHLKAPSKKVLNWFQSTTALFFGSPKLVGTWSLFWNWVTSEAFNSFCAEN